MSILSTTCPEPRAGTSVLIVPDEHTLLAVTDPLERARQANEIAGQLQSALQVFLKIRRAAVRSAVDGGTPRPELAQHIGVTTSRVGQLLAGTSRNAATCPDVDDGAVA